MFIASIIEIMYNILSIVEIIFQIVPGSWGPILMPHNNGTQIVWYT
jgi:hypothetical protein